MGSPELECRKRAQGLRAKADNKPALSDIRHRRLQPLKAR